MKDSNGTDMTDCFERGAAQSLTEAIEEAEMREEPIEGAILKKNSPSCSSKEVYDGSFSGVLIPGVGIFAQRLIKMGITVSDEDCFKDVFALL